MELLTVLLIAVGLAMDAFAVSLCKGLALKEPTPKQMLIIGLWFGVFQGVMPIIGFLLGTGMYDLIRDYDHWIAFALLFLIGANMIRESFSKEEEKIDADLGFGTMFFLAVATSIDALAVGITLAMDSSDIISSSIVIGIVTMAISVMGVRIGALFGDRLGKRAELIGGIILICIGIKIVVEHLGLL